MNEWECEWKPTERDQRLHELATRYHVECETYDRTVCSGPVLNDSILPMTHHERGLITRNAHAVRKALEDEARSEGIGREELARAISRWHGSVHNALAQADAACGVSPGAMGSAAGSHEERKT